MIVSERLVTYINSLDRGNSPLLDVIEQEALDSSVPIIRKEMQSFLKWILALTHPKHILEVGTAVGFSTLLMAENTSDDCIITTIESYGKRIPVARANFARAGLDARITLLEGDAAQILPTLTGSYDFIFMDAAKGQYIHFLPEVLRLLADGGTLVSDNVLQDGDLLESHYIVERRNRTIYKRMREYLYELTHRDDLVTAVLPVGDGVAVTTKTLSVGDSVADTTKTLSVGDSVADTTKTLSVGDFVADTTKTQSVGEGAAVTTKCSYEGEK